MATRQQRTRSARSSPLAPPLPGLRLLLSYFFFAERSIDQVREEFGVPLYLMADSGAYSARMTGQPVSLDAYIAWLHEQRHQFVHYINLDEIGDGRLTYERQQIMEGEGLTPVPVFHFGDDWYWLDAYLERYSYIMLGGMVVTHRPWTRNVAWVAAVMRRAGGRAAFHALGLRAPRALERLPLYSIDSSQYLRSTQYRRLTLFDARCGAWRDLDGTGAQVEIRDVQLLESYGLSPGILRDLQAAHNARLGTGRLVGISPFARVTTPVSAAAWLRYERYLRARHGPIAIPGQPQHPAGLISYLVLSAHRELVSCPPDVGWRREVEHPYGA